MEKKVYVTPCVEEVELQGEVMMQARSLSADDIGIKYGGNAGDHYINSADANKDNVWEDLW